MRDGAEFYTLKGYSMNEAGGITSSMEDYLEMIFRLHLKNEVIRINKLSEMLHVKPSSASKMAGNLKSEGLVEFERYGYITLTEKGAELGKYLFFRHDTINQLLCFINRTSDELEQTEKVEHFINAETVRNMRVLLDKLREAEL